MENEDIITIEKPNGIKYSVRKDRNRYFYPYQWKQFINKTNPRKRGIFEFLINTGCRINEARHIRLKDFDFDRNNVRIWKTKTKAKKKEKFGKPRTISISSSYCKEVRKYYKDKKEDEYLYPVTAQAVWQMTRRTLKKAGIKDWYNFGLHNIRKTHGMWLKAIGVDPGEICLRLGHDMATYLKHYGSADIFNERDIREIETLFDDLYLRRRRY